MRAVPYLALGTILAGYATIVLGGYVSSIGAGLACPDWPTCHGQLIPDLADPLVAAEYLHRLAAVVAGIMALGTLVLVWVSHRANTRLLIATNIAFGLLVVQVLLGWVTVASFLEPLIVTGHLAVAAAFILVMTVVAILAYRETAE